MKSKFLSILSIIVLRRGVFWFVVVILPASLVSCGEVESVTDGAGPRKWTVLFYTAEDNDLETYAFRDLAKLVAMPLQGVTPAVTMLLDTKNYGSWDIRIDGNPYDKDSISMVRIPNRDMADLKNLIELIRSSVRDYPAERYALIFQGHSSGWYLTLEENKPVSAARIANVIRESGTTFEFIGFDGCLMSNIETVWEFRAVARHIIACEDYGPWEGLVDPGLLTELAHEDNSTHILRFMSDMFIARNAGPEDDPADIAVVDTAALDAIATFLVNHGQSLQSTQNLFTSKYSVDQYEPPYYNLQDLYSLAAEALAKDDAGLAEFKRLFSQVVTYYRQNAVKSGMSYAQFHHGLSIVVNGAADAFDTTRTYSELGFPICLSTTKGAPMSPVANGGFSAGGPFQRHIPGILVAIEPRTSQTGSPVQQVGLFLPKRRKDLPYSQARSLIVEPILMPK